MTRPTYDDMSNLSRHSVRNINNAAHDDDDDDDDALYIRLPVSSTNGWLKEPLSQSLFFDSLVCFQNTIYRLYSWVFTQIMHIIYLL